MGICLCCGVLLALESLSEVCELLAVEGFSELRLLIKFILELKENPIKTKFFFLYRSETYNLLAFPVSIKAVSSLPILRCL